MNKLKRASDRIMPQHIQIAFDQLRDQLVLPRITKERVKDIRTLIDWIETFPIESTVVLGAIIRLKEMMEGMDV